MSMPVIQRFVLPSAIVVAILAAAGCSGGHHSNPASGVSTAPMPAAPAPTTSSRSALYSPAGNASSAMMAHGTTTMAPATASTMATANTGNFASEAASGGMLEIKLAEAALSKSHNGEVKSFARRMKKDHTAIDEKLKDIVGSGNGSQQLPTSLMTDQQQMVSSLESRNGKEFDRAYADAAVKNHQQAITLFENASHNAATQQLREFASQTLPKLKEHLHLAERLKSKVGG